MKKLVLLGAGAIAIPVTIVSAALIGPGVAGSDPGGSPSLLNVVGEPYGQAVGILKNQGVKATFGGSVGSDVPQAQCIVDQQKVIPSGKMILMLNCTKAAVGDASTAGTPGPASLGGNGIKTVQATPVGPAPDANSPVHAGGQVTPVG